LPAQKLSEAAAVAEVVIILLEVLAAGLEERIPVPAAVTAGPVAALVNLHLATGSLVPVAVLVVIAVTAVMVPNPVNLIK
jgi:hypothetical protein